MKELFSFQESTKVLIDNEFQLNKQIKTNKPDSLLPLTQQRTDLHKPSIYSQSSPNGETITPNSQSFLKLMRTNLSG